MTDQEVLSMVKKTAWNYLDIAKELNEVIRALVQLTQILIVLQVLDLKMTFLNT